MASRGGRRGGRNPKDLPRNQQVSRKGGYVNVQDALNTRALKSLKITFPELKLAVTDNDKQRFSMILASSFNAPSAILSPPVEKLESEALAPIPESDDPADYLIRANQGHSIKVETEGLLTPILEADGNVPEICVHGTDERAWRLILKSGGLRKMDRNHIHFASGLPAGFKSLAQDGSAEQKEAPPIISGMRRSSTVLVYVDIRAALAAGLKFFVSENGVILTEGNEKGFVPIAFFKRVESRKQGGGLLMKDGVLPDGMVVDAEASRVEDSGKGKGKKKGGKAKVRDDSRDLMAGM